MRTIDICSLPELEFAHVFRADQYVNSFPQKEAFLEISYVAEGLSVKYTGKGSYVSRKGDVSCLIDYEDLRIEALQHHCHHTIGVKLQWQYVDDDTKGFYVPIQIPEKYGTGEICRLIDEIIYEQDFYKSSNIRFAEKYLELLGKIDQCARQVVEPNMSKEKLYALRAKQFVQMNIHNPLTQREVAQHLGISPEYLCNVFKRTENMTLMKYINRLKLESMKALMEKENVFLYEAAALYGYADANYVSRLFKQLFGYNATENPKEKL